MTEKTFTINNPQLVKLHYFRWNEFRVEPRFDFDVKEYILYVWYECQMCDLVKQISIKFSNEKIQYFQYADHTHIWDYYIELKRDIHHDLILNILEVDLECEIKGCKFNRLVEIKLENHSTTYFREGRKAENNINFVNGVPVVDNRNTCETHNNSHCEGECDN